MTTSERIKMLDEAIKLLRSYRSNYEICTDREAAELIDKAQGLLSMVRPNVRDNPIYSY